MILLHTTAVRYIKNPDYSHNRPIYKLLHKDTYSIATSGSVIWLKNLLNTSSLVSAIFTFFILAYFFSICAYSFSTVSNFAYCLNGVNNLLRYTSFFS